MNFMKEASTSHKVTEEASTPSFFGIKAYKEGSIEKTVTKTSSSAVEYMDSSTLSLSLSSTTATNFVDEAVYYGSAMHVWRYPVSKPIHKDFRGQIADSGDVNMYFTFTLCDELAEHNGDPGDY